MRFRCFLKTGKIGFSSNRNQSKPRETNVFIADWVDTDEAENVNETQLKNHLTYLASDELQRQIGRK